MARGEEMTAAVSIAAQAGVGVLVWGPPGVGKSSAIAAMAGHLDWHVEALVGSVREASDFGGLPMRGERGVVLAAPAFAYRIIDADAAGRRSVLFLDELTTATPSVQAAMLRVVLDRVVGDVALPASTAIVAAANPGDLAADGHDLAPALANRFCHLDWALDAGAWAAGMVGGWAGASVPSLPEDWQDGLPRWRARVAAFVSHRPELLHALPPGVEAQSRAWPSPRSWDMTTRVCAAAEAADPDGAAVVDLLIGCVGEGPATEYLEWLDHADLPDPEALLADPGLLPVPGRGDLVHAALGSVVAAVAARLTRERWEAAWAVLGQARQARHGDVAAVAARPLMGLRRQGWPVPQSVDGFAPILTAAGLL